jgi:xanthine dehydrogenase accessory factor
VGLVASERRAESILSELRARGFGEEALKVVRSPAGLPIGASGQEEISLSIMAEIISLRAKPHPGLREEPAAQPAPQPGEAIDPVCGMTVEVAGARHVAGYGGQDYYFCCPACKREFEAEPEKYVSPISA